MYKLSLFIIFYENELIENKYSLIGRSISGLICSSKGLVLRELIGDKLVFSVYISLRQILKLKILNRAISKSPFCINSVYE